MDNPKRHLITLAIFGALLGVSYFGAEYFVPASQQSTSESSTKADPSTARGADGRAQAQAAPRESKPSAGSSQNAIAASRRLRNAPTVEIKTDHMMAKFTASNAALVSLRLRGARFRRNGQPIELVTTDKREYLPLRAEIQGVNIPDGAQWKAQQLSPRAVAFRWSNMRWAVVQKIEAGEAPYQLWSTLRVENRARQAKQVQVSLQTHHYVPREDEDGGFLGRPAPAISHGICRYDDELVREDREELASKRRHGPDVRFVGVENGYFANVIASDSPRAIRCELESSDRGWAGDDAAGSLFSSRLVFPKQTVEPRQSKTYRSVAYVGPKDLKALTAAGHDLDRVVDLGWFSWIASGLIKLMSWIHGHVGNWGIAIILLTVMVKIVLYPLTERSFRSMARMRQLKPEMDRINELYADDREKKGAAIMELYRKHKINPLGGCLPSLLQLPIWFALYQSLSTNIELYHTPFALWWTDLSSPDPYYTLPLLLGGLMFLQQKLTPTTMDPVQAKMMMYFMPIMITVFMLFLPAGLCLYMVTNSTLGIAQQKYINWRLEHETPGVEAAATASSSGPAATAAVGDSSALPAQTQQPKPTSTSKVVSRNRSRKKRQRRGRA